MFHARPRVVVILALVPAESRTSERSTPGGPGGPEECAKVSLLVVAENEK